MCLSCCPYWDAEGSGAWSGAEATEGRGGLLPAGHEQQRHPGPAQQWLPGWAREGAQDCP